MADAYPSGDRLANSNPSLAQSLVTQFFGAFGLFALFFCVIMAFGFGLKGLPIGLAFATLFATVGLIRIIFVVRAWSILARTMGLTYQPPTGVGAIFALLFTDYGTVLGTYRGRDVTLIGISKTRGIGNNRSTSYYPYLQVRVATPPENRFTLNVHGQPGYRFGLLGLLRRRQQRYLDATPDSLGQPGDSSFTLDSDPPELGAHVLSSDTIRATLLQLDPYYLGLENGELQLTGPSAAKRKPDYLRACIDVLCDMAETIERV